MSSTRVKTSSEEGAPDSVESSGDHLVLSLENTEISKNGIEFHSPTAIPDWTEMTIELKFPNHGRRVECSGVVVSCMEDVDQVYRISMVFMNLSPQAQTDINLFAPPPSE
jgi:hypothetical protein